MTQHAARKMRLSSLGLPADVKVCRRFISDIHRGYMQTKLSSLRFMLFIKGPRKGSPGKKKEEEKDRDRGRKKHPKKIFTAELRKFAEVIINSQGTHITKPQMKHIQMRNSRVFLSSPLMSRKQRTCHLWQASGKRHEKF